MVFDATIRPSGRVGLQPRAGMKRFTLAGQPDLRAHGIVYAVLAVASHVFCTLVLGEEGWAHRTGGQRSKVTLVCLSQARRVC
jgi:hypothetical protein